MKTWIQKQIEPKKSIPKEKQIFSNSMLLRLLTPVLIEQFLALLVGLVDTMMISYAGEAAVSGVSLVNQLNNIFIMIFGALAAGGSVIVSQYVGRRDRENSNLACDQLYMIIFVISIAMTVFSIGFGTDIFHLLFGKVETAVFESGMIYLYISALSFPFLAIYNAAAGIFRSVGDTKTVMWISILMNTINIVGNAIGIFVLHAGVAGVAYPTLLSRIVGALITTILCFRGIQDVRIDFKGIFSWHSEMISRIFRIAIPNSIENGLFQISKVALSSIVALFGTIQIAANGVAQSFWSVAALFPIAMGPVFITVVGQCVGAKEMDAAEYYLQKLLKITIFGAVLWDLLCVVLAPFLLEFYALSEETIDLIILLVILHDVGNGFICPIAFSMSNGLRAAGDVKYTMNAAIFATCVVRVLLSILFGQIFGWGVIGITLAMISDWIVKAILIYSRYRSGKWKQFQMI